MLNKTWPSLGCLPRSDESGGRNLNQSLGVGFRVQGSGFLPRSDESGGRNLNQSLRNYEAVEGERGDGRLSDHC